MTKVFEVITDEVLHVRATYLIEAETEDEACDHAHIRNCGELVTSETYEESIESIQSCKPSALLVLEECGSCGCYHQRGWYGDCRADHHRFASPEDFAERMRVHIMQVRVIDLEEQVELATFYISRNPETYSIAFTEFRQGEKIASFIVERMEEEFPSTTFCVALNDTQESNEHWEGDATADKFRSHLEAHKEEWVKAASVPPN